MRIGGRSSISNIDECPLILPAVIETLHQLRVDENKPAFDSTRGVFVEGEPIYPGAAIQKFNHIQICIRNSACVKGYFRLREE